jgi:3-deoxy-7-phosphoheptulonate synthase
MVITMHKNATAEQIRAVTERVRELGYTPHEMPGAQRTAICITGNKGPLDPSVFTRFEGVIDAVPVSQPYKLVSRELKPESTVVEVRGVKIGGDSFCVMAGPCSVENIDQLMSTAQHVKAHGAQMLRGGAFKPRTSPYDFQGLKEGGLKMLAEARDATGLPVVTEVKDVETLPLVAEYADVLQIGARNMQNFSLLKRAGRSRKPVLLKRGMSATVEELLMAAEYIMSEGNYNVILCERGVRTFADHTRNTLDLSVVPAVQRLSHLPIIVDPSHGTGKRNKVTPLSRAAVAVGADGLIIEVHPDPDRALSDGKQSLFPEQFDDLMGEVRQIAKVLGRSIADPVADPGARRLSPVLAGAGPVAAR